MKFSSLASRRLFLQATAAVCAGGAALSAQAQGAGPRTIEGGDTAWMLMSTILVMLMVLPGLALFYSGLVRRKNALSTCALVLGSAAVVTLAWIACGYSLVFTPGNQWIGSLKQMFLSRLSSSATTGHVLAPTVPEPVFILFQLGFAMVTVGLIFGAVVERIRFRSAMIFALLWTVLVYAPVAHWIWNPSGGLYALGHMDYAGGTVVHLASGIAGLVLAVMTGARHGYGREPMPPHNLLVTIIGAGMLWIGWFGFNGGSAMQASPNAAMAVMATQAAAAAGVVAWILCEWITREHISVLGIVSGLLAGLVCITPASGYVGIGSALAIGLIGSVFCFFAVTAVKSRLGYDDSLDVFGLHGVAGFVGSVLTGVFQTRGDVLAQTATQLIGALFVVCYVGAMTYVIVWVIRSTIGLRVTTSVEIEGLDIGQHGESLAA